MCLKINMLLGIKFCGDYNIYMKSFFRYLKWPSAKITILLFVIWPFVYPSTVDSL